MIIYFHCTKKLTAWVRNHATSLQVNDLYLVVCTINVLAGMEDIKYMLILFSSRKLATLLENKPPFLSTWDL